MSDLHLVEIYADRIAVLRHARQQGVDLSVDGDGGYAVHAWLLAAFGDRAPRPFRIYDRPGNRLRLLGYATADSAALRSHLADFSSPLAAEATRSDWIVSRSMPRLREGRVLRFEVLACPVIRKARSGVEKDAFLAALDRHEGETPPSRAEVYGNWFRGMTGEGADVLDVDLEGFRLVRMLRRPGSTGEKKTVSLRRPVALLSGRLRVRNEERFFDLVSRGIGRHGAFGYGMLLLSPP